MGSKIILCMGCLEKIGCFARGWLGSNGAFPAKIQIALYCCGQYSKLEKIGNGSLIYRKLNAARRG